MTDTMRAVRFHGYGGPGVLALEQLPRPRAAAGQVLVRIHAASINPIDWKLREGEFKDLIPLSLPIIAGQDLAGVIEAVGDGVTDLQIGDAVYAMTAINSLGAYADTIVLDRSWVARKPASLDFAAAAAVPMGALTAWQGIVETGGLRAGQRLFVHAAGGNVGGMAVQIAHAMGAHVTAAGSAAARELAMRDGAETFIDYAAAPFEQAGAAFDIVFDTLAGDMQARSWGLLKRGGILVSTLFVADPTKAASLGVRATAIGCVPNAAQLTEIATLIDAGKITPKVAKILPLEQAADAQELNRAGKTSGKVVLTMV